MGSYRSFSRLGDFDRVVDDGYSSCEGNGYFIFIFKNFVMNLFVILLSVFFFIGMYFIVI